MQIFNYQFKPRLIPTLALLAVLPLFINLGLWQSGKADLKQAKQQLFDERNRNDVISIGDTQIELDSLRYSRVVVRGVYEPQFQIFLDNQISKGRAGYHVLTPLHINGSAKRILINRGWVPVGEDRSVLPRIETPAGEIEVIGQVHEPIKRYIELGSTVDSTQGGLQQVWQNLDMKRYAALAGFPLQPAVILMDPENAAGGYVREWPKPDFKIETNRGYAMQWYFMSIALVIIYLVTNLKKIAPRENANAKQQ